MMMISVMWWMHCKLYKPVISCLLFTSKISQSQDWWWSLIPPQPVILSDSLQFSISLHPNILSPVWYWQRHPPTSKWLLNNMDASLYLKVWNSPVLHILACLCVIFFSRTLFLWKDGCWIFGENYGDCLEWQWRRKLGTSCQHALA